MIPAVSSSTEKVLSKINSTSVFVLCGLFCSLEVGLNCVLSVCVLFGSS